MLFIFSAFFHKNMFSPPTSAEKTGKKDEWVNVFRAWSGNAKDYMPFHPKTLNKPFFAQMGSNNGLFMSRYRSSGRIILLGYSLVETENYHWTHIRQELKW
jgi:hypothetical protein